MKIGLALSGGGARGFAHFGVLKALKELGVEIDAVAGTSAGSIAAAFHAHGYSPEESVKIITKTNLFKIIWPAFSRRGILTTSKSEEVFRKYFENDSFNKAKIPLSIVAANLNTGKPEIFREGSLVKSMMASCCIPFIFDPVNINGQIYVDGGIVNNLPAEAVSDEVDVVIGVNAAPVLKEENLKGTKQLLERISMVSLSANVEKSKKLCDVLIEPKALRSFGTFDIKKAQEIFDMGYESTIHQFEVGVSSGLLKKMIKK